MKIKTKKVKSGVVKENYERSTLNLNVGDVLQLINAELQYGTFNEREYGYFMFDKGNLSLSKFGATSSKTEWEEGDANNAFRFPNTGIDDNFESLVDFINDNNGKITCVAKGTGRFGDVYAFA